MFVLDAILGFLGGLLDLWIYNRRQERRRRKQRRKAGSR
jgi:membrane associated rhomboid family serine protease